MSSTEKFDQWCVVELFGHTVIAGKVKEQTIGGISFIRIDVPETIKYPGFSKLLHQNAIYGITPCDEEYAKAMAENLGAQPLNIYNHQQVVRSLADKIVENNALPEPEEEEEF